MGGVEYIWTIEYTFNRRFRQDKIYCEKDEIVILIDGIVLNSRENQIRKFYEGKKWKCAEQICKSLRGPFTGIQINKRKNVIYLFGNQTGDTTIFYYCNQEVTVAASDINILLSYLKKKNIKFSFDTEAAEQMLSLGYLVEKHTFIREIKRTNPGCLIKVDETGVTEERYHRLSNQEIRKIDLDEAIELVDIEFKKAVKRCFDKDLEYGYNHHLVDISGGYDSRMVNRIAKEIGYSNITNISYAKRNSFEYQCASAVSQMLNNEFIFKTLDDLHFINDIDDILRKNNSLSVYIGITGGNRFLNDLNFDKFGLEHTGMIGDVVIGSFIKTGSSQIPVTDENVKRIFFNGDSDYVPREAKLYPNYEMYAMYYRAFQSAVTSHYVRRSYTEAVSPFLDVDFLNTCMSIPLEYRIKHKLYFAWMQKKYPDVLTIPSTHPDPNKKNAYNLAKKILRGKSTDLKNLLRRTGMFKMARDTQNMHPLDYWYQNREDVRSYMDGYFKSNIWLLDSFPEIQEKIQNTYYAFGAMKKFQSMTVLGAFELYFGEKDA